MSSNSAILQKADWALSDLASNGGLMNPEQSDAFIRKLLMQPTLLSQVRRVVMSAPKRKINKIQFANRIMRAGVQGGNKVDLDDSNADRSRSKPTTEQIELNTQEVIAEVRLPYEVIEDNIEGGNIGTHNDAGGSKAGGGIVSTVMDLIAERAALDLEELALLGNTASSDLYLKLVTGYLARATANVVDAGTDPVSRALFKNGMKTLPSQYRRNRSAMRHFISTENEIEYREILANRETSLGDSYLQGVQPVYGSGSPVEGVGLMPSAQGLLTHPLNLIFGIQRAIHIETDKDIRNREYIIVLTARVDFQIEEDDACVKYINIGG
ncbi:MAG TPA: hypothetical protein VGD46_14740 [Rhizobacter sp.]